MKNLEVYFEFLNYLRDTGVTNMYGAAPYLVEAFDIDKYEARKILSIWMNTLDNDRSFLVE